MRLSIEACNKTCLLIKNGKMKAIKCRNKIARIKHRAQEETGKEVDRKTVWTNLAGMGTTMRVMHFSQLHGTT